MKIQKGKVFAILAVMLVLVIWFYPRPLTNQLGLEQFESKIEMTLLQPTPIKQNDGSTIYEHIDMELVIEPDSQAAQELYDTMKEVRAVRRWRLPFEHATIYRTSSDSLGIEFQVDGRGVNLSQLSDSRTIYDLGTIQRRQFYVNSEAFEKLASIVKKYGVHLEDK